MRVLGPSDNIIIISSHAGQDTSSEDGADKIPVDVLSEQSRGDESPTEGTCVSSQYADHPDGDSRYTSYEPPGTNDISGVPNKDVATDSGEDASTNSESLQQQEDDGEI